MPEIAVLTPESIAEDIAHRLAFAIDPKQLFDKTNAFEYLADHIRAYGERQRKIGEALHRRPTPHMFGFEGDKWTISGGEEAYKVAEQQWKDSI